MLRTIVTCVALGLLAGCSSEPPPAAQSAALVSGIDLSSFDPAVRPQDDLFRHVNGAWLAKTEIPADKSSFGTIDRVADRSRENLRAIAEEASRTTTRVSGSDAQKIGDFYDSFMNETLANERGITPLHGELARIDGLRTKTDLARYVARLHKLSVTTPIVGYVDADAQQPSVNTLYVYQGGLGLPDSAVQESIGFSILSRP